VERQIYAIDLATQFINQNGGHGAMIKIYLTKRKARNDLRRKGATDDNPEYLLALAQEDTARKMVSAILNGWIIDKEPTAASAQLYDDVLRELMRMVPKR
jgi:hypothetical protein